MNFGSEDANRAAKATAYADAIQSVGGTAATTADLPDRGWELARQLAGWAHLPSEQTKRMVVDIREEREARQLRCAPAPPPLPADPFAGLS